MCFRVDEREFNAGDVIPAGRWGSTVLKTGEKHLQYHREKLMESIRVSIYPDKPSRLTSNFAFPTLKFADHYFQSRWDHGERRLYVYQVVPIIERPKTHIAEMGCLPTIQGFCDEDVARWYWSGKTPPGTDEIFKSLPQELLIESDLMVIGCCTT